MVKCSYCIPQCWCSSGARISRLLNGFEKRGFSSVSGDMTQFTQEQVYSIAPPISGVGPYLHAGLLQHCIRNSDVRTGKALHCEMLKRGGDMDLFGWNVLLNMYVKTEFSLEAQNLFDEMPKRNTVSFVTLIHGLSQSLQYPGAIDLFVRLHREGHELNPFVFTTVLKMLVNMECAESARNIHGPIYKLGHDSNAFVGTGLVDAYTSCGYVNMAKEVFDGISCKDMVSWTGMVTCYAENDYFMEALDLFTQMQRSGFSANNFTLASVFKACIGLKAIDIGKSVHGCALKTCYEIDAYVGISLLDLYTQCGDINAAKRVFEEIPKKDVIPWSFLIARYSQSGKCNEAVELFHEMRQELVIPNQFTFGSVLQSCATLKNLGLGKQVHCHVQKNGLNSNVYVSNALIDVYAKCGMMEESIELFCDSTNKNEVTWNTLIVGYVQLGEGEKALSLFKDMIENQVQLTQVTYSSVLRGSAGVAALEPGMQIHCLTVKTTYDEDIVVANALIDMYAKCGSINNARLVFDMMANQDVVSWNAMISGYSMHGLGAEALCMFERMQKTAIIPNDVTFVGVLAACSNTGSLDRGESYFNSMAQDYSIEPCIEHYTCMVSLFGRLGHLAKAVKLIEEIPIEHSIMLWRSLLAACVIHKDVELGRICAQHVLEMDPEDDSTYILLSNIYASVKRWDNVASVRKRMKNKGVKKEPGLSWIENRGEVHYFTVGDSSHPNIKVINGMLEWLNLKTKTAGYDPNCDAVLLDVEDDEKARLLWVHSERIALAFGLVSSPSGSPIRIMKNLRICMDCHALIKFISKVVQREIIIRDINRFHHFENGRCSCGDYW